MKDFYYILGISKPASISEIKTAYRKLSHKFHPDKNDGDIFFEERFKDIDEAYKTLVDINRRRAYDMQMSGFADRPPRETAEASESSHKDENKNDSSGATQHEKKEEKYKAKEKKSSNLSGTKNITINFKGYLDRFYTVFGLVCGLAFILYLIFGPGKNTPKAYPQTKVVTFTPVTAPVYPTIKVDSLVLHMPQEGIASSLKRAVDSIKANKVKHVNRSYITIGSTKDEVIRIQGTPQSITGPPMYEERSYGLSSVVFDRGILKAYNNFDHNLKIRLVKELGDSPNSNLDYFTIGSSKNDVIKVQGTPSAISGSSFYEEWSYGLSSVVFDRGRVKSFNNFDHNLRVLIN